MFADLGLPDPDVALAKADLTLHLAGLIEERGWAVDEAALVLGMDSTEVSRVLNGDVLEVPLERLLAVLTRIGRDIEIAVVPSAGGCGSVAVRGAAD